MTIYVLNLIFTDILTLATLLLFFSDASKNLSRFVAETEHILSFAKNWELPVDGFQAAYKRFFGTAIHRISGSEQFTNGSTNGNLEASIIQLQAFLHTNILSYPVRCELLIHSNLRDILNDKLITANP